MRAEIVRCKKGGDAVYPRTLQPELLKNVGDFYIDCERMPGASDLKGREKEVDKWLDKVQLIRDEQTKLFDYLLSKHPTDFTMLGQSCEDRTPDTGSTRSHLAMFAAMPVSTVFGWKLFRISTSPSTRCWVRF